MRLKQLRLCGFQSFGPEATTIEFGEMNFLLGPNGAGKTAVLQALARLFGTDRSLRRIRRTDFNIEAGALPKIQPDSLMLWIEAEFEFPELEEKDGKYPSIPVHFSQMRLQSAGKLPTVRFRLSAEMDSDGEIDESLVYVIETDDASNPIRTATVPKSGRNAIEVHYLPARRDPGDHISYTANSLLGRTLRSADWHAERGVLAELTEGINKALAGNPAVSGIGEKLARQWTALHTGAYYASPSLSFERNEIDSLLRHLTVGFTPGHGESLVDFSRLSDGQQSLLYLSLVLAIQAIGREVLADKNQSFDVEKLRPAVFTMVAMEEPENSLSPHHLGRVIKALTSFASGNDAQAIVATHAPSILKRVPPENIRYLRLDDNRRTQVASIVMPDKTDDAYKFVREAVQAFPELYFSRLVVLGEGDSEEILLPRLLESCGLEADEASISVVPLGGRHVNHFWRLLHGLGIPHVTLLDLDISRHQGGWGRCRYAIEQLIKFPIPGSSLSEENLVGVPKWNDEARILIGDLGKQWIAFLESSGVFFSTPLDLDFMMMSHFPDAYDVKEDELKIPDEKTIVSVLGKSHGDVDQYDEGEQKYFGAYHRRFKGGSKPAAHLDALAQLESNQLADGLPAVYKRILMRLKKELEGLPE